MHQFALLRAVLVLQAGVVPDRLRQLRQVGLELVIDPGIEVGDDAGERGHERGVVLLFLFDGEGSEGIARLRIGSL